LNRKTDHNKKTAFYKKVLKNIEKNCKITSKMLLLSSAFIDIYIHRLISTRNMKL